MSGSPCGVGEYAADVENVCRRLGVATPEDPYLVWRGAGGPVAIVPLFLLYDGGFREWRPCGVLAEPERVSPGALN